MISPLQVEYRPATETRHAKVRKQQRCIPDAIRDLLFQFGQPSSAGGGAIRYAFDRKGWRQAEAYLGHLAKHFAKYRGVYILVSDDGVVITEAWIH